MSILASFSDYLFPRTCAVCGRMSDRPGRTVCSACLMRLPFISPKGACRVCGRAVEGLDAEYLCTDCRGKFAPAFDRAASALRFEGAARTMILDYKFHRHLHLVPDFVDFLEAALLARFDAPAFDLVVPIPSTRWHRYDRGYNPTDYLARQLAKRLDRRCDSGVLTRVGHPVRQAGLDEAARRLNAAGTFRLRHPERVRGRTVLLVDDVMTTGATLSEAARTLKRAGSVRVGCVSLARSIRD